MIKRSLRVVLLSAIVTVLLVPVAAVGLHDFVDVEDSNVFHDDISWLADNNVTLGCNPPANDQYCPDRAVTRAQMAAFMRRLATNQIVDAKTAMDADMLDGMDSTDFLGAAETAADSALLAGMSTDDLKTRTFAANTPFSAGTGLFGPSGAPGEILTVTFEVPVAGSIIVNHSTSVLHSGTDTALAIGVTMSAVCDTVASPALAFSNVEADHGYDSAAGTFAYQVAAGTHTVRLCGEYSAGDVSVRTAQLSVVYEPGGTAAAPAPAAARGASSFGG